MFYELELQSHIRVDPNTFSEDVKESILKNLNGQFSNYVSKEIGIVVGVSDILEVGDGIIIPGDGAAYYKSGFRVLVWKPELQELVHGTIVEITNFGAFMQVGPAQGMIHISQTMEDYVSFSKTNTLLGKSSKKNLKQGDLCLARIVAISHKGDEPKIGLTMRQNGLGKLEWVGEEKEEKPKTAKKASKGKKK